MKLLEIKHKQYPKRNRELSVCWENMQQVRLFGIFPFLNIVLSMLEKMKTST